MKRAGTIQWTSLATNPTCAAMPVPPVPRVQAVVGQVRLTVAGVAETTMSWGSRQGWVRASQEWAGSGCLESQWRPITLSPSFTSESSHHPWRRVSCSRTVARFCFSCSGFRLAALNTGERREFSLSLWLALCFISSASPVVFSISSSCDFAAYARSFSTSPSFFDYHALLSERN